LEGAIPKSVGVSPTCERSPHHRLALRLNARSQRFPRCPMTRAKGFTTREHEFQDDAREVALRFLEEAGDAWTIALQMAEEHQGGVSAGDPSDSQTSHELFVEFASDLGASYELACGAVQLLARGVAMGMDRCSNP
jgi:hypothetical protein